MGLHDLVRRMYDRCLRGWPTAQRLLESAISDDPELNRSVQLLGASVGRVFGWIMRGAEEALVAAEDSLGYSLAADLARAAVRHEVEIQRTEAWQRVSLRLAIDPTWAPFADACELASRIDSALDVLDIAGECGSLARAARQDLNGLWILADWCEENGRPQTAAEIRHLAGLLRFLG